MQEPTQEPIVQDDRESEPASPSPSTLAKPLVKVSCLACRAAKRKCLTPDAYTVCKRCTVHGLPCEYKKHRRGRRKKVPDAPDPTPPATGLSGHSEDHPSVSEDARRTRLDIQFSHVVPIEGDSSPYLPGARNAPVPDPTSGPSLALLRTDCPDPVLAGFLSESDAYELFEFYFHHLNVTVAILDPVLHTATYCRDKSPLLFAAVLTVTAKIIRPKAYSSCLLISNKLIGQAVEYGLCSVEVVQAINLLTHWKKADDATSWRKVGYAIRMAQELRLNVRSPRPLPRNERQAREVLNRERCWLNLIVADYHLAIHHSLPRMINDDDIDDPVEWITEHPHLPCPGESVFAPWITFSRMCRLYADMLASMNGDESNLRSLSWIEMDWKRWRRRWVETNHEYNFLQQQLSTIKLCDALFRFHICEYRLLFFARYRANGQALDTSEPTSLSLAFAQCVDAALALAGVFQTDFVRHGYLPFCFNLTWVALAITAVWLIKNIVAMDQTDRSRVIRTLSDVQFSTEDASCSSDDMAAYTHRLLKHLLSSVSPEWQLTSFVSAPPHSHPHPHPPSNASSTGPTTWTMPSAQQIIQEHLWHPQMDLSAQPHLPMADPFMQQQPQQIHQDDLLFPAADDDIWKLLFPVTEATTDSMMTNMR